MNEKYTQNWYNIKTNMHHNTSKKNEIIRLSIVYTIMVASVLIIVAFISLFMLGYRFDNDGKIEQYGLLQFSSSPAGASVSIDGNTVGTNTPTKKTVEAGSHNVVMWRNGYESWNKTVDVKSGTIVWLNYALMVPTKLKVESVASFAAVSGSTASPKGGYMLIQAAANSSVFDLVDISADTIKTEKIEIPANIISQASFAGVSHSYTVTKWDDGERYVLIKHTFADQFEWLLLDTQDADASKNITTQIGLDISDVDFFGTNGRSFYVLHNKELKKINLSNNSISRTVASNVLSYRLYNKSSVITFVALNPDNNSEVIAGIFRDGDSRFYNLRSSTNQALMISAAHYFNVDYVAIADGAKVDILSGSFPSVDRDSTTSLKLLKSFTLDKNIGQLSFSPSGQYVFMQTNNLFTSYNLEYEKLANSSFSTESNNVRIEWINDNYIWSDTDGRLTIREFDGQNAHLISKIQPSQDAVLTRNGRFIYSIDKTTAGYQLQRVRMILP